MTVSANFHPDIKGCAAEPARRPGTRDFNQDTAVPAGGQSRVRTRGPKGPRKLSRGDKQHGVFLLTQPCSSGQRRSDRKTARVGQSSRVPERGPRFYHSGFTSVDTAATSLTDPTRCLRVLRSPHSGPGPPQEPTRRSGVPSPWAPLGRVRSRDLPGASGATQL